MIKALDDVFTEAVMRRREKAALEDLFEDVTPDAIQDQGRGSVSWPILKAFTDSGKELVKLTRSDGNTYMALRAYIAAHKLPIRIFTRKGAVFLQRTDKPVDSKA